MWRHCRSVGLYSEKMAGARVAEGKTIGLVQQGVEQQAILQIVSQYNRTRHLLLELND